MQCSLPLFRGTMWFLFFYLFKTGFHVAQVTLLALLQKYWGYWHWCHFVLLHSCSHRVANVTRPSNAQKTVHQ